MLSPRSLRACAVLAVVLSVAGCGYDGPASGVQVAASATEPPGGDAAAGGAQGDMALEASDDGGRLRADGTLPAVASPPPHLPEASLPSRLALPDDLPATAAVVGDSLTLSAEQEITAYLTGLGIDVLAIDGAVNRRMTHGADPTPGLDIVERIASVASPELWVIALGTNDVGAEVSPERFADDVGAILAAIPDGAPVVWVDYWIRDRREAVERANGVLRDELEGRDDTIVADWFSHGDDAGLVAGDGVHLTEDGRYMFAATIASTTVDLFDA